VEPRATILVVDDIPMFRELESVFLARCGRVVTAPDLAGAREAAEQIRPDVIVLDAQLPDGSGTDLCRDLKGRPEFAGTPIVLITASGSAEEHAAAIHAGADDVLSKPLDRLSLVESVQRFVRFQPPRGLPRVSLRTQVRVAGSDRIGWGTALDISRGGMFLESEDELAVDQEIQLEFRLPELRDAFAPTARVIWRRPSWNGVPSGAGLRFVDLDAPAARALESYVHERAPRPAAPRLAQGAHG
jgi:uncharacterized protein (TIGR02266 family)